MFRSDLMTLLETSAPDIFDAYRAHEGFDEPLLKNAEGLYAVRRSATTERLKSLVLVLCNMAREMWSDAEAPEYREPGDIVDFEAAILQEREQAAAREALGVRQTRLPLYF